MNDRSTSVRLVNLTYYLVVTASWLPDWIRAGRQDTLALRGRHQKLLILRPRRDRPCETKIASLNHPTTFIMCDGQRGPQCQASVGHDAVTAQQRNLI